MVYGIYQSAGGMQVNQYRQEVLANNLANASTIGFKPDVAVVRERQIASKEDLVDVTRSNTVLDGMTGGSLVAPTYTSFDPGAIQQTGGALDVALRDDGFFRVQDGRQQRYTRDGRFTLNGEGQLVTVAGNHPVLGDDGQPITVPGGAAGRARIDANGEVRSGSTVYGRIGVVTFDDKTQLRKTGGSMYQAFDARPQSVEANLLPGALESSGADPTKAMVSMIEVSRAYQLNATLVGLADTTLGRAVNDIARLR